MVKNGGWLNTDYISSEVLVLSFLSLQGTHSVVSLLGRERLVGGDVLTLTILSHQHPIRGGIFIAREQHQGTQIP